MLGRRWYRLAYDSLPRPIPADLQVLGELPERFGEARRILNVLTDRFLFQFRERWFGIGGRRQAGAGRSGTVERLRARGMAEQVGLGP